MSFETWQQLKTIFHAALELRAAERSAFLVAACSGDSELLNQVEKLIAAHDNAGSFLDSPAVLDEGVITVRDETARDSDRVGQRIGPYEILRAIGHGGMGTVFLAVRADDQYRKEVAIKLVNRGMDTDSILRRFMMERQILANLEHANIARLLEGGSTTDGLPYFVMEYVEGEPIDRYCDVRGLTTAERLELFRKVCAALQYAHQNLVVHRDIKPSNILVTAEGVPKLLDFGIAKLLSPDWDAETGERTASIQILMTPAYASPEQLRGQAITTTSDVYSLGVVLYELLSGQRPYRMSSLRPEEMAQLILTEEPERPSSIGSKRKARSKTQTAQERTDGKNPQSGARNYKSLVGDLDNIVLKALRKEPQRRYTSVQEFSDDIRRHLEGLPVSASPDTFGYRAGKFVQRHRAGVFAAAAVLVTLLTATGITTWQASVARRERDKAEHRFNQVRKLANSVLFDYHDGIEKLPGSTPIREKMVKDALEYLDNLSTESTGDPNLQAELATAYEKVGDVQGNPYGANLGNQDGALKSYQKSLTIREALFTGDSKNYKTRSDLARSYEKVGDILWAKGESTESQESYRKALAINADLSKKGNLADAASLSRLYNRIGETQEQAGDFRGGLESHQNELRASTDLVAIEPTNASYQTALLSAYVKIGDIYFQLDDYKQASEHYQQSLPILQQLVANDQTNTNLQRKLSLVLARLALAKMHTGELSESVEYNRQAIQILNQMFSADPNNAQIRYNLTDILSNLAEAYWRKGNLSAASETFRDSISRFNVLLSENPKYAQVRSHFANTYSIYAGFLLKTGNPSGALDNYERGLMTLEATTDKRESTQTLAEIYEGIADAESVLNKKSGNLSDAKMMYQKSLAVWTELQERGRLPSDYLNKPDEVKEKIVKCDVAHRN